MATSTASQTLQNQHRQSGSSTSSWTDGLIEDSQIECARFVASDLDEHGFFTRQLSRYALSIGHTVAEVRRVLAAIRALEPAGLGATDVAHAFALQIARVLPDLPVAACAQILRHASALDFAGRRSRLPQETGNRL